MPEFVDRIETKRVDVVAHEVEQRVVDRIRAIGRDPALVAETVRQARAQLEERRRLLDAERRQLTRGLGHQKAAMKQLLGSASGNSDFGERLAEIQDRIQTIESRLAAVGQEIRAAEGRKIDERDVASALEAFGPVWDAVWPAERARILGLLVERIDFDGRDGSTAVGLQLGAIGLLSDGQSG